MIEKFSTIDNKDEVFLDWAKQILNIDFEVSKHLSSAANTVFELKSENNSWFLKIGPKLESEYQKLTWLEGKTLSPEVVGFKDFGTTKTLLTEGIKGYNLYDLSQTWDLDKVIDKFTEAILKFHSIDFSDCPFGEPQKGLVLTHGDACLPNFIFSKEGEFKGFIDLGDMKIAKKDVDLAAAVWSLQFGIGAGYGLKFLKSYGVDDASQEMVNVLWHQYNDWIPLKDL